MNNTDREAYPKGNRPKRSTNKAAQILNGALPEFLQHGYGNTSMDRVAKSAGVSKQTLYSYYSDKQGLFTALVEYITSQKIRLEWSKPLAGEPKQVLWELASRILTGMQKDDYLSFVRLIVAESATRPDLSQLFLKNISQPAIESLSNYFQLTQELHLADTEATARVFIDALIYFTMSQEILQGKTIMPMESDRYVNNLINLVLNSSLKNIVS